MKKYQGLLLVLEQASDVNASFSRWLASGITSVSNILPRQNYWTDRIKKKGPIGKSYASAVGVPVGKFLDRVYKVRLQTCLSKCTDRTCRTLCHIQAANGALTLIQRDIGQLAMIKDDEKRARMKVKLEKNRQYYVNKKRKFESEVL